MPALPLRDEPDDALAHVEDDLTRSQSLQMKLLVIAGIMFVLAGIAFFRMELTVRATGVVLQHDEFIVFSPAEGVIASVDILEGDLVMKGEPLCALDDKEIELELLQKRRDRQILEFQLAGNELNLKESKVRPSDPELAKASDRLTLLSEIESIQRENLNTLKSLVEKKAVSQTTYQEQAVEHLRVELERMEAAERVAWLDNGILEIERERLILDRDRLRRQIDLIDREIAILEEQKRDYQLTAPITGRVTDLIYKYAGMAVAKGAQILKISNPESPYIVIAQVGERNFDLIRKGTPVRMESKVFNSILEGAIYGQVTIIDPEGTQSESETSEESIFRVEIEVEETPHPLVLGSGIDVYFLLGNQSLLKMLFNQPQKRRN